MRRRRLVVPRVVALLAGLFWGWLFFGLQDSLAVFDPQFSDHWLLEAGWGLLFLLLIGAPLLAMSAWPRTPVLLAEVAASGTALVLGALFALSPWALVPGVGVLLTALGLARLADVRLVLRPGPPDVPLLALALLAVPPAMLYAVPIARSTVRPEETWYWDHYPVQAAAAVAAVLVALVVAFAPGSPHRLLVATTLSLAVIVFGLESVIYPAKLGSAGTLWGWLLIGWGVLVAVLTVRSIRIRERQK